MYHLRVNTTFETSRTDHFVSERLFSRITRLQLYFVRDETYISHEALTNRLELTWIVKYLVDFRTLALSSRRFYTIVGGRVCSLFGICEHTCCFARCRLLFILSNAFPSFSLSCSVFRWDCRCLSYDII